LGLAAAIWTVAGLTALSGLVVSMRMYETRQHRGTPTIPPWEDPTTPRGR
jgi:hypothetical protein